MALIEKSLKDILDSTGSTAYPLTLPDKAGFPSMTYKRIGTYSVSSQDKVTVLQRDRFQIDCYAKTYNQAKTLAQAVTGALLHDEKTILVENSFDSKEEGVNPDLYRVTLTVFLYE